jgi:clan AA aspartic protease (TIGR02281 family)
MAQKTIVMEQDGGVYRIPCKVNGAKMKMVFDTGASSVSISSSIAQYLYDNDYITKDDVIGTGKSQVADGRMVDHFIINLRDIEIDGIHVQNVKATVSESLTAPLLFGQSAIQKLGKISLNGNILTIENYTNYYTQEQIDELDSKINQAYNDYNYYLAAKYLTEMERLSGLSFVGYNMLCNCYCQLNDVDNCIDAVKRFENNCSDELESEIAAMIYTSLATVLGINHYCSKALSARQKSVAIYIKLKNWESVGRIYMLMGGDYYQMKEYLTAIDTLKKAVSYYTKHLGIPDYGIKKDETLALMYSLLSTIYAEFYSDQRNSTSISYLRKSVQCGDEDNAKYLKELGYSLNE